MAEPNPTVAELDYLSQGIVGQDAMISSLHGNDAVFTFGDTRSVTDGAGQTMISSAVAPASALNTTDVRSYLVYLHAFTMRLLNDCSASMLRSALLTARFTSTAAGIRRAASPVPASSQRLSAAGATVARLIGFRLFVW
jgi:hypothetical protein